MLVRQEETEIRYRRGGADGDDELFEWTLIGKEAGWRRGVQFGIVRYDSKVAFPFQLKYPSGYDNRFAK